MNLPSVERRFLVAAMSLTLMASSPGATGTRYRFRSDQGAGTVWLRGSDARLEPDPGDSAAAGGQVKIWQNGGEHVFVLDTDARTYYDEARRGKETFSPTLDTLAVRDPPFVLIGVSNLKVDVRPSPRPPSPLSATFPDCQPVAVSFSYDLKASIKVAPVIVPGWVKGTGQYCFSEAPPLPKLPFGHAGGIVSGIGEVDALIAEKLSAFRGTPVHTSLTVTRQMEGGEEVSRTKTLDLSDVRAVEVPVDRFKVPEGFRDQEPVITPPVRQQR